MGRSSMKQVNNEHYAVPTSYRNYRMITRTQALETPHCYGILLYVFSLKPSKPPCVQRYKDSEFSGVSPNMEKLKIRHSKDKVELLDYPVGTLFKELV